MCDQHMTRTSGRFCSQPVILLMQLLIECRKYFEGDIDLFLVFCIIDERTHSVSHERPDLDFNVRNTSKTVDFQRRGISLNSLTHYSGIPRETVRRKIGFLIEKGWVVRVEGNLIVTTQRAKERLGLLTLSSLTFLTRLKGTLAEK